VGGELQPLATSDYFDIRAQAASYAELVFTIRNTSTWAEIIR